MLEKVRSGDFDRIVTIEVNSPDQLDTHNDPVITWEPFASNVSCHVKPVKGGENLESDTVTAVSDKMLTMRWMKDVSETMRINFENEYYDILLIQEIGRRRGLKLTIRKKDNARH